MQPESRGCALPQLSPAAAAAAAACTSLGARWKRHLTLLCRHAAGTALQALAALLLASGVHALLTKPPAAKAAPAAAAPAAAVPRTPTPLGPPRRGGRGMVVGPPTGGLEASPAAAMAPSSAGRPSPFGSRVIATPEQLQRVLVSCGRALGHHPAAICVV